MPALIAGFPRQYIFGLRSCISYLVEWNPNRAPLFVHRILWQYVEEYCKSMYRIIEIFRLKRFMGAKWVWGCIGGRYVGIELLTFWRLMSTIVVVPHR